MRVVVDLNRCQAYAQCCYDAPDRFEIRGHEILFYDPAPPEVKRLQIERAEQASSFRAIAVEPADLTEEQEPRTAASDRGSSWWAPPSPGCGARRRCGTVAMTPP